MREPPVGTPDGIANSCIASEYLPARSWFRPSQLAFTAVGGPISSYKPVTDKCLKRQTDKPKNTSNSNPMRRRRPDAQTDKYLKRYLCPPTRLSLLSSQSVALVSRNLLRSLTERIFSFLGETDSLHSLTARLRWAFLAASAHLRHLITRNIAPYPRLHSPLFRSCISRKQLLFAAATCRLPLEAESSGVRNRPPRRRVEFFIWTSPQMIKSPLKF